MSLGVYNTYLGTVFSGDTINLLCKLDVHGQPVTADQVTEVNYTVQTPSIMQSTVTSTDYPLPATEIGFQSLEGIPNAGTVFIQDTLGVEEFQYTGVSNTISAFNITG